MLTPFQRKLGICTLAVLVIASLVVACDVLLDTDESTLETTSFSISEAKARGIWVMSLKAVPGELVLPEQTIHINAAWVEANSHCTERLWGSSEHRLDGFSLCFTLTEDSLPSGYHFFPDDDGVSVATISRAKNSHVYKTQLEHSSDATKIRLSLMPGRLNRPLLKNISFVAQP